MGSFLPTPVPPLCCMSAEHEDGDGHLGAEKEGAVPCWPLGLLPGDGDHEPMPVPLITLCTLQAEWASQAGVRPGHPLLDPAGVCTTNAELPWPRAPTHHPTPSSDSQWACCGLRQHGHLRTASIPCLSTWGRGLAALCAGWFMAISRRARTPLSTWGPHILAHSRWSTKAG